MALSVSRMTNYDSASTCILLENDSFIVFKNGREYKYTVFSIFYDDTENRNFHLKDEMTYLLDNKIER